MTALNRSLQLATGLGAVSFWAVVPMTQTAVGRPLSTLEALLFALVLGLLALHGAVTAEPRGSALRHVGVRVSFLGLAALGVVSAFVGVELPVLFAGAGVAFIVTQGVLAATWLRVSEAFHG